MDMDELLEAADREDWGFVYANVESVDEKGLHEAGVRWLWATNERKYLALTVLELNGYPERDRDAVVSTVGRLVSSEDKYVRYRAAFCLVKYGVGKHLKDVVKVLVEASKDEDVLMSNAAREYASMLRKNLKN